MASTKIILFLVCIFIAAIAWCFVDNFDPYILKGKKILITGASSGIGEQLAYQYSKYGATVVLVARRANELKRVVSKCRELGANEALYIVADLSSLEEARRVHKKTLELVQEVNVVILNHVMIFSEKWSSDSDLTKVPSYFAVNTFSYINIATLFLSQLQKSNGSIIVVSSVAGLMGIAKETCYSSNKHALHGFFNSLRQDLVLAGHSKLSITICIIGPIDTPGKNHFKNHEKMYWYPADECAWAILKGGALRLRQMYYPYMLTRSSEIINGFFPELFETLAQIYASDISLRDGVLRYFRL